MKVPRFEELARQRKGQVSFFIVYVKEAHARGAEGDELRALSDQLRAMDANRDGRVALAEFRGMPRYIFDAYDVDRDGVISSHEFLTASRVDEFKGFAAPTTYEERVAAAKAFRGQVAGTIPVLVDELDNRVAKSFGGLPNSSYLIDRDGTVKQKLVWASANELARAIAGLVGGPQPERKPRGPVDLSLISPALTAAKGHGRNVLLELTAPGCGACKEMARTTLADPAVVARLPAFEVAKLSIESDAAWALFENLDFHGTPAFALLRPDGTLIARAEGLQTGERFLSFLAAKAPLYKTRP